MKNTARTTVREGKHGACVLYIISFSGVASLKPCICWWTSRTLHEKCILWLSWLSVSGKTQYALKFVQADFILFFFRVQVWHPEFKFKYAMSVSCNQLLQILTIILCNEFHVSKFDCDQVQMVSTRTASMAWLPICQWNTQMLLYLAVLVFYSLSV